MDYAALPQGMFGGLVNGGDAAGHMLGLSLAQANQCFGRLRRSRLRARGLCRRLHALNMAPPNASASPRARYNAADSRFDTPVRLSHLHERKHVSVPSG